MKDLKPTEGVELDPRVSVSDVDQVHTEGECRVIGISTVFKERTDTGTLAPSSCFIASVIDKSLLVVPVPLWKTAFFLNPVFQGAGHFICTFKYI